MEMELKMILEIENCYLNPLTYLSSTLHYHSYT